MRKFPTPGRRLTSALVLLLSIAAIAATGTLAIYTSQVYQRAVVRNRDTEAIRFSSDKLFRTGAGTPAQRYYYPLEKGQNSMSFLVCNYDQTKNTLYHEETIDYTVTFQISNGTESFDYDINGQKIQNGETLSLTGSLTGGRRSEDRYTIQFAPDDYNKLEVTVSVTPDKESLTRNNILNGILVPIEYAAVQGLTMRYEYPDSRRTFDGFPATPDQFDAYNLLVSMSGGEGTVRIRWNADELDIDPFFQTGKTVSQPDGDGFQTIEVPMNADDETGTYLISFYNHGEEKPTWTQWGQLPIEVEMVLPEE